MTSRDGQEWGHWRIWAQPDRDLARLVGAGIAAEPPHRVYVRADGCPTWAEWTAPGGAPTPLPTAVVIDLDDPLQVIGAGNPEAW